jgi:hypothetical protein
MAAVHPGALATGALQKEEEEEEEPTGSLYTEDIVKIKILV